MKYKVGDKVIIGKSFMGDIIDVVYTINDAEDDEYFMEEDWFWYGEEEIDGLVDYFIINSRFEILDL